MAESSVKCKSFVSEAELESLRKKRQEEWEKVRKPEDPLEAPEEEYDPRSLFERLEEQRNLRETELEESRRLKNLIKGLDDDEVAFLELVDQTKIGMETKIWLEEKKELQDFRQAVSHLTEEEQEAKLQYLRKTLNLQGGSTNKKSQHSLLAGALKRKATSPLSSPEKKQAVVAVTDEPALMQDDCPKRASEVKTDSLLSKVSETKEMPSLSRNRSAICCLGVLPGLGAYTDSSDSENSSVESDGAENDFDLIGRRKVLVHNVNEQS